MIYLIFHCNFLTVFWSLADLKDVSIANPSRSMDGTTIRPLYNAVWNLDSFCISFCMLSGIWTAFRLGDLLKRRASLNVDGGKSPFFSPLMKRQVGNIESMLCTLSPLAADAGEAAQGMKYRCGF